MTLRLPLCAGALLLLASPAFAADHVLDIDNRVGKFETFYAHATAKPLDADARFKLWQTEDGLAAVPPGPDGDKMARKLLANMVIEGFTVAVDGA